IIATGTLGHNFGGDGAGTVSWLSNGMTLGNNGLWYQYNSATELIITQDQGNGYIPVVRLTITNQATGAYSIEQLAPVRHPLQGIEDDVAFTVSYQVRDRDGDTDIGTITVNVNDSLPLAVKDDAVTIDEDSGIHSGNVMTNDFVGGDGATMTKVTFNAGATWRVIATEGDNLGNGVFGFTLPGVGTYTFKADGSWTFAPAQDFNGQTGFAYIITDSDGDESDPAVSIENTLTITVTPVNDAPVISIGATDSAADELTETNAGLTATGTLTVTDVDLTDVVTTSITFLEISGPDYGTNLTHGELNGYFKVMPGTVIDGTQTSGTLTWEFDSENQAFDFLAANTRLVLKYTITVTDSAGATATRIVEIGINGTNDAPVISGVDATLAYTENDPATVIDTSITIVDVDNATLQGATVWISIGFVSSEDVLGFVNQNGITGSYNTSTGVLQLTGSATVAQYKAALESVAYQNTSDNPSAANRTISYSVSDGTATSNVGTATVTVTPVNDAAIISGDVAGTVVEDAVPNTVSGNLNSTDVDNDDDAWQVASGNGTNGYGTFAVNAAGEWTYTLDNGNAAVNALNVGGTLFDTFTVATVDGTSQFVTVTIQGANDAAIISGDVAGTVVEDAVPNTVSGNLDSTDVDNDDDTFQPQVNVAGLYGNFSVDAAGVWTYTLDNANPAVDALNVGGTLLDTFTVATVDGTTQLVTITIQGNTDNVAPVANEDGPYALLNSQILTMTTSVLANDVDSQPLTAELVSTTQNGVLVFNPDGTFTYDPVNTFVGVDTFTYRAFDGALYSNPITVSIIVAAGSVNGQTIDFGNGQDTADFSTTAFNGNWTILMGNGSDNLTTAWDHGSGVTSYYAGNSVSVNGNPQDRVNLVFTDSQLDEIFSNSLFRNEIIDYLDGDVGGNNPSAGSANRVLDLSTSSWGATVANFYDANLSIAVVGPDGLTTSIVTYTAIGEDLPDYLAGLIGSNNANNNLLVGTSGNDVMHGGISTAANAANGNDILVGGAGDDTLYGGGGSDLLLGGVGNDILFGGTGDDILFGGAGDDILNGGLGRDILVGGAGADTFVFDANALADAGANIRDLIADYNLVEGDVVDLSALLGGQAITEANKAEYFRIDGNFLEVDVNGGANSFVKIAEFATAPGPDALRILVDDGTNTTVTI
ncbi:MAG: VCBS domain-containing protein, partial [Hoeflea sp.]|uniref:VCBS domain-containing protein n=1 Tax=Hoeflea sp. TaxID=1940281 RepID=UPI002731EE92